MPWRSADDPQAWVDLDAAEAHRVWDQVYGRLGFRPSMAEDQWPGFKEPAHSATFEISSVWERYPETDLEVAAALRSVLSELLDPGGFVHALDWQHPSYRFIPGAARPPATPESWLVPVLPNGDYYLFLADDTRFGWLGHPWEQTVCVYGELLEALQPFMDRQPWPVVRVGGDLVRP